MRVKRLIYLFITTIILAGCMDIKEIQNQNYVMAIGADYQDGKFFAYAQMVDFTAVAKTEGRSEEPTIYVAKGEGPTSFDAFIDLYNTTQESVIWSHVTAIVLSEEALKKGFDYVMDGMVRYQEYRLTPWVFGTRDPIEDIFKVGGFYNQSPLDTILHNPNELYEQNSEIKPMKLYKFASQVYEPSYTVSLPSITINKTQWETQKKKEPKLAYDGVFFIQNEHYKGFFTTEDIKGHRWITPQARQIPILVPSEKEPQFLIMAEDPSVKITPNKSFDNKQVTLEFKANAGILNRPGKEISKTTGKEITNLQDMQKASEEAIKKEIMNLHQLGSKEGIDFFNVAHTYYRDFPSEWKQLSKSEKEALKNRLQVENIKVKVDIKTSGSLRNKGVDVHKID